MTESAVVVDASVVLALLVDSERSAAVRNRIAAARLHAPAHLDAEVLCAVGRLLRAEVLTETEAALCLSALRQMPVQRHSVTGLIQQAWRHRADIGPLDALYVALAEQLDLPLITADERLARTVARAAIP